MPITAANGTVYSDDQIRQFVSQNQGNPQAIAAEAAQLGLNASQIQQGLQIGGYGGPNTDPNTLASGIQQYVAAPNSGYSWGANGQLTTNPQQLAQQTTNVLTGNPASTPPSGIQAGNNFYSAADVKNWMAGKTPAQVAAEAAQLGLNESQIQQAYQMSGQNYTANDINQYVAAPNSGYSWGANGALTANPPASAQNVSGQNGLQVGNQFYTTQQIQDYLRSGGDPAKIAQQNGITDLGQIHNLTVQADQLAGTGNYLTGEAALQNAFKQYQQYSPNGRYANNYQGWLADLQTGTRSAIESGTYSGQLGATAQGDWSPGGIYGPGSSYYGQQGYASGLGPRGMGALGGGYGGPGAAAPGPGTQSTMASGFQSPTMGFPSAAVPVTDQINQMVTPTNNVTTQPVTTTGPTTQSVTTPATTVNPNIPPNVQATTSVQKLQSLISSMQPGKPMEFGQNAQIVQQDGNITVTSPLLARPYVISANTDPAQLMQQLQALYTMTNAPVFGQAAMGM